MKVSDDTPTLWVRVDRSAYTYRLLIGERGAAAEPAGLACFGRRDHPIASGVEAGATP